MPKKKQPKNSFYFYMLDFREEQEQMGVQFRGGMKEVADLAGPAWKELPLDQRAHYESLAAQHKMKEKGNLENKFTTTGISYAQLEKEVMEKRQIEIQTRFEIQSTVEQLHRDTTLRTHVFYFVHFNYYCRIEDGSYLICEVAIAQFNLQNGVKDVYHTLVRQARIPTGYSFESKSHSEETHQIPLPDDLTEGEPYRGNLFFLIKSFIEQHKCSNGTLPPLYAIDNHVDVAQNALTMMAEYHYPQNPDIFRVYPLSKLFYHLRNAASPSGQPAFPVETLAMRELDKDQYNFAPGISCSIHEKNDSCVFCSKSIVQRWAFLICDHCCKDLKIQVIPGKHVPINAAITQPVSTAPKEDTEDDFHVVKKRGARALPPSSASASKTSPRQSFHPPLRVVDLGKTGPPEDTAHHYNINPAAVPSSFPNTSVSKSTGNCWGGKSAEPSLRRPTELPSSVREALKFTEEDFPDLSGRSSSRPAAVAGRGGRGRTRIVHEEISPGGLNDGSSDFEFPVAGRGRGKLIGRTAPRLAASLQGLQIE